MKTARPYCDFRKGPLKKWEINDNDVLIWSGDARSYPEALRKMKEESSNGRKTGKQRKRKQQ